MTHEEQAVKLLTDTLWDKWEPMPIDHYSKGEYSGMLFLKFESQKDRDCALGLLNKMDKVGELANMWSKAD